MKREMAWVCLPAVVGVGALWTGYLPLKMGVPVLCAAILGWCRLAGKLGHRDVWWVVAAFAFSAAGDYFLSNKRGNEGYFIVGIGLFLVAHVGYMTAAWLNGRVHRLVLAVLLLVFVAYYVVLLYPAIESGVLSMAVLGYLLVSCWVLAVASGLEWNSDVKLLYVLGIALIVLSDTAISFNEFLGFAKFNRIILPTYYLAHLSITLSLLRRG